MSIQFQKNIIIKGLLISESGFRIGGSSESIDIGGIDNVVIRDPKSGLPFVPGSSHKGRIRSILELSLPEVSKNIMNNDRTSGKPGDPCSCGKCEICILFGTSSKDIDHGPSRAIFRDAFPTQDTIEEWKKMDNVVQGTEVKFENTINRLTSEANPRQLERVPRGSKFNFEIIYSIYSDEDYDHFKLLFTAMKLIEDRTFGGGGSRGNGKIRYDKIQIVKRSIEYYKGNEEEILLETGDTIDTILKDNDLINKLRK